VGRHFSAAKNLPRILWKSEIFSIEAADALRPLLLSFVLWEENRRSFDYGGKAPPSLRMTLSCWTLSERLTSQ
jgi:hypothetical protein